MNAYKYTPRLNFEFVHCALRGWPGVPQLVSSAYPLRVVVKKQGIGETCVGAETDHGRCSLETSWGTDPIGNIWRPTAAEVNTLLQLCTQRYRCDIRKAVMNPVG